MRALINDQFPHWTGLTVEPVHSEGTVNAIFRIGGDLTARLPLQAQDATRARATLLAEADAAREILGRSRFGTPEPIAVGEPGHGYPLPWSVQTWVPGVTATEVDPGESIGFAHDLAEFISVVRSIDTRGRTFDRPGRRGGHLLAHDVSVQACLTKSEDMVDVPRLRAIWARLRDLPRVAPDVMVHADLTPGNVPVADGRLTGVLDCGTVGPADPALDLVAAWHLLEPVPRQVLRQRLQCDDIEWQRGKAWAFEQAIGALWYYVETNPGMAQMGRRTLARILADDEAGWR